MSPKRPRLQPVAAFHYWQLGGTTLRERGGDGEVLLTNHVIQMSVNGGFPFAQGDTILIGGLSYDLLRTRVRGDGLRLSPLLHRAAGRVGLNQRVAPRWRVLGLVDCGAAGDPRHPRPEHVVATALVAASVQLRPHLKITFGALYTNRLLAHLGLPVFGVEYWTGRWLFDVYIPQRAGVFYRAAHHLHVGLKLAFVAGRFHLHDRDAVDQLRHLAVGLGPVVRWFVMPGWFVSGEGGWLIRYDDIVFDRNRTHRRMDWGSVFFGLTTGYLY
jgi:hypothetical protein